MTVKRSKFLKYLILLVTLVYSCQEEKWTPLLDQNLSQWDNYLSYKHKLGYTGEAPRDEHENLIMPVGINSDSIGVFTIIEENKELVLKISGEYYGCVFTKNEYSDYHLKLKFRWGENKWTPRKSLLRDSGILYHSIGPLGAEHWRTWMLSQEFQIMEGHIGDYWNQATSAIDIKAFIPEYIMNPIANKEQPFISVGHGEKIPGFCLRSENHESPFGSWNALELICFDGKSIHIVNGHIVMILKNSRYVDGNKSIPLKKGKIQLQSEAAEVYYKDINIREIKTLPQEYLKYFQ